jgi:hypothetical protein
VTSTDAATTSCSAWLIKSAATNSALAVSSAKIAISVGPASESIPINGEQNKSSNIWLYLGITGGIVLLIITFMMMGGSKKSELDDE